MLVILAMAAAALLALFMVWDVRRVRAARRRFELERKRAEMAERVAERVTHYTYGTQR